MGYGGSDYEVIIAVELPLPWPVGMFTDPERMPAEVLAVMQQIRDEYERTHQVRIRPLGIAPDAEYSVEGMRRIIAWRRPQGPFSHFEQSEYLVPEDRLGPLFFALALDPNQLGGFAAYQQETGDVRDLLVCTHGSVDAACSKFGYPTYARLRRIAAESGGRLRAWRTTHFGGHVFAPTLIDLPHGSYWAYIEAEEAELLARQESDPARLRQHYRGWTGVAAPFLQVLERELFMRHGWAWRHYAKVGRILAQDEEAQPDEHGDVEPSWAEVQIDYVTPNGESNTATARIEMTRRVESIYSSGSAETYAYPQYEVAWLQAEPCATTIQPCRGEEGQKWLTF
ncbi:MAG: sucrase ferredoxin [Caldilineaceae bacterium]|nr:sucrase ferredoxin [Caldilineaceae bacterium]